LLNSRNAPTQRNKSWSKIWSGYGLPKIKAFCWLLSHNIILTIENLRKRAIVGPLICVLCQSSEESIPHLFLTFPYSLEVWQAVFAEVILITSLPSSWEDMFL